MLFKNQRIGQSILLPLLLLIAGLYLVPISIFERDFSQIPGDFGDARFNNYILEHGHQYLTGKVAKYWDAPFMYPYKNVIAFSDNLLGTVPIYSAFRILGNDRETSYQLWLLTLFALNFVCCYWVLKRWSKNLILSATGAYVYAFSIFIIGHIYNVQSFPRFIVPFVFYWGWKYLSQKQLKYFLSLVLGIVYQFYCGIYLGFLLVYTILFLFISYIIVYKDKELFTQFKKIRTAGYHVIVILLGGVLIAPLMLPYIEISHTIGLRHFEDVVSTIPTLRSYFFTSTAPVLWNFLSEHGKVLKDWWCHFLFIGALPWLGIISGPFLLLSKKIVSERKKFISFISLGLLLSFIFCLNMNGITLYKIIFNIPGFSSMRSINRVINTEVMYFILIFVFVFNEWQKAGRIMKWIVMSFPVLIILDNLIYPKEVIRYDKQESQEQIEIVKNRILNKYNKKYSAVAYMPDDIHDRATEVHLNAMLATQELNIPCVNAYTGSFPNAYIDFFVGANDGALEQWIEYNHLEKNVIQKIDNKREVISERRISLQAENGKYLSADKTLSSQLVANRDSAWAWETFSLILFEKNECVLLAWNKYYLCDETDHSDRITASRNEAGPWETFLLVKIDSDHVAFRAVNGKYLSVDEKSMQLFAKGESIGRREKFKLLVK